MRYEIAGEVVTIYLNNPKRQVDSARAVSFAKTCLTERQITPMLETVVKKYHGKSIHSQITSANVLRAFFAGFREIESPWPETSVDWNVFLLRFFQFCLTNTNFSQAKTLTRTKRWTTEFNVFLNHLKDEEIIPIDVVIPIINQKKVRSLAIDQHILGQKRKHIPISSEATQKLLVDISFGMTDSDYLDNVEKKCRQLVGIIKDVCLTHWNGLMKDAELGRQMAAKVTDVDIESAMTEAKYGEIVPFVSYPGPRFVKYASPLHPDGVHWALALVRCSLNSSSDIHCVSAMAMRFSPFSNLTLFRSKTRRMTYSALDRITSMKTEQWEQLPSNARFYRFAGLISPLDVGAACCLLTIEHAQFTSESLQNALLLNVRGKPRLLLTDNNERSILCLDKPRSGKLKSAALSELAQGIVRDIVRLTAPVREVLKRAGHSAWRYLFLGVTTLNSSPGVLSALSATAQSLTRNEGITLVNLYPELAQNGLGLGGFDYRRLRNTIGIIRWFETGSILEMSRTLGNSRKVALENYLPPALLHAWNTRIIRRFQNSLIVLAAHDEPYLLEVTDFSNLADLQHFIAQLILDYPSKTSPLADEVHRRLGGDSLSPSDALVSATGCLNVRLSPRSLAYLYAFRDLALQTLSAEQQDKVDTLSGLSPRKFIDMAQLFIHAAENTALHPSLRELMDVTRLVEAHDQALALKGQIDAQFSKLGIECEWEVA